MLVNPQILLHMQLFLKETPIFVVVLFLCVLTALRVKIIDTNLPKKYIYVECLLFMI